MLDSEREGLLLAVDHMLAEAERDLDEKLIELKHLRDRITSIENTLVATVGLREELDTREATLRDGLRADLTTSLREPVFEAERLVFDCKKAVDRIITEAQARLATVRDGIDGEKGEKGDRGEPGERGADGINGHVGDVGERGEKGDKGDPGEQGERGFDGPPGDKGESGEKGDAGERGTDGAPGERGDTGDKGDPGERGDKGDPGDPGERGDQGEKGDPGDAGAQGERGDPGEPGERGENGEKGDPGLPGEKGERGDAGLPGEPGLPGEKGEQGERGLPGEPGERGLPGERGEKGDPGEKGERGADGMFTAPLDYVPGQVFYESQLVSFEGSTYCARCDTAKAPPHEDWSLVALAGRDGRTGMPRGLYDPAAQYGFLDRVSFNGSEWIACRDNPGPLPGETRGWMIGARAGARGKEGKAGPQGERGPQGEPGATIERVSGRDYTLTLEMTDGHKVAIDFKPMFERYRAEVQ